MFATGICICSGGLNRVYVKFPKKGVLHAQLRSYYLDRDEFATFHSVILAGVYDVKNIRRKIRPDDKHKMNSPWNIAADFDVVMSFSRTEIAGLLF